MRLAEHAVCDGLALCCASPASGWLSLPGGASALLRSPCGCSCIHGSVLTSKLVLLEVKTLTVIMYAFEASFLCFISSHFIQVMLMVSGQNCSPSSSKEVFVSGQNETGEKFVTCKMEGRWPFLAILLLICQGPVAS